MKNQNKNVNSWNCFSRGICVTLLIIAAFCGICGLGAAFSQIPWLLIAGGICLLLMVSVIIWFLGYMSKKVPTTSNEESNEVVTVEPIPSSEEDNTKSYRVVRQPQQKAFNFDEHNSRAAENFNVPL